MRCIIVAGFSAVLLGLSGGQASAELEGFFTNSVVQNWNSDGDRRASKRVRQSRRVGTRKASTVRRRMRSADSYDDGSRPQRRSRGSMTGVASYYWQPQRVASGGWFNPNALTAAHKTLPFGTRVRVTHLRNGRSVVVRINDRGPYIRGRIIDLSKRAAGVIGMRGSGIARVRVDVLGR